MPAHPSVRDPVDRLSLLAVGALLLVVSIVAFVREVTPEWRKTQATVRAQVRERLGEEKASRLPSGVQQVWIERLARVDRCTTCHVSIEAGKEMADAPNPAKSHPRPELLAAHPVEKFGCTICHGGQGSAVTTAAAHGDVPFWDDPLLSTDRAKRYGLTAAELMESKCATCHLNDTKTEGTPRVNAARELMKAKRCLTCHRVCGKGGIKGPELTFEGDKNPEHFHFPSSFDRPRTALGWHVAHLLNPPALVHGSEMPVLGFSEADATSLALLVSSWRKLLLPPEWIPVPKPAK